MLISSQFSDISCRFHMRARQTSAMYVPLSLLFKEISFGFLLVLVLCLLVAVFKNQFRYFFCKVLHDPWVKKHNKNAWMIKFNIYTAASLKNLCQVFVQRTLLAQGEVPRLVILKLWCLDDKQGIREKETNISKFLYRYAVILKMQKNRTFKNTQTQGISVPL